MFAVVISAAIVSGCGSAARNASASFSPPLTDASSCQAWESASTSVQDAYAAQLAPEVDPPSAGTGAADRDAYAFGYIGGRCHRDAEDSDAATIPLASALGLRPLTATSTCQTFEIASWSVQTAYASQVASQLKDPSTADGDAAAYGAILGSCHRESVHGGGANITLAAALGLSTSEAPPQAGATETPP